MHQALSNIFFLVMVLLHPALAQQRTVLDTSHSSTSFRGIAVVSDKVFWVSGSRGTVGRSNDGGKTFQWVNPRGFEHRDFRDVEALSNETALVMAVDSPGIILKTTDGGNTWREVYRNNQSGIFLDDMHFYGNAGMCVGDALHGRMMVLRTLDAGDSWQEIEGPRSMGAEGCFAASGTNLLVTDQRAAFVTGGLNARLHIYRNEKWQSRRLPILQGTAMTGPNSLMPLGRKAWVIVGGDYNNPLRSDSSWVIYHVKRKQAQAKHGLPYCSVVVPLSKHRFAAAGLNGWFLAERKRREWTIKPIDNTAAHTAGLSNNGRTIFAAGPRGRILKMEW